jgi:hypothetical protein
MKGGEHIRHRFRKLRIASSAACGIFCSLLILLWVRSYWQCDRFDMQWGNASHVLGAVSRRGLLAIGEGHATTPLEERFAISSTSVRAAAELETNAIGFRGRRFGVGNWFLTMPYWFPALLLVVAAALPWKHFSLRTLLIAVTLVAAILRIIVISI